MYKNQKLQFLFIEMPSYMEILMSILNFIKPKWKNSDPEIRLSAIEKLSKEDQDIFEELALHDIDMDVRISAIRKLTKIETLLKINTTDGEPVIQKAAENTLIEEISKYLRDFRGVASPQEFEYIDLIANTKVAEELLKRMPSSELRLALVNKCSKPSFLSPVALKDPKESIAITAVNFIESKSILSDISEKSIHNSVRQKAIEKLKSLNTEDESENEKKILLIKQREVLIQQAKRLNENKNCLSVLTEFNNLMEEANKLGMGLAQNDLDALYLDFKNRCAIETERLEEKEKKAQELKQKEAELTSLLDELDHLLSHEKISDHQFRIEEIIDIWNSQKTSVSTLLLKRFELTAARYNKTLLKEAPNDSEEINLDISFSLHQDLIDQLELLTKNQVNANTSNALNALIENWESLPQAPHEEDLTAYQNALIQIKGKINDYELEKKSHFNENIVQLKEIIENIKKIDEAQDFNHISKLLRDSYSQWVSIVGEDKFAYKEIWQEYKEATSRFQEMKEWEAWHNERDKEALIEEIEKLSKEEECTKETLIKLRSLHSQWRNIGLVSPDRVSEFKEKFQNFTQEVLEHCAPLLEEQKVEKEKNLKLKEDILDNIEQLFNDESIAWRERFKSFLMAQSEWKAIGHVPKDKNQDQWDRFQSLADLFYNKHKEEQKKEDLVRQKNYEEKQALCEKAEALQNSEEWNETSNQLIELQEEWKRIGPVPKVKSEEIWTRFRLACDVFFQNKRKHFEGLDSKKADNLKAKEDLCEKLESLELDYTNIESLTILKEIEAQWNSIGHVPKEEVDSIYKRYSMIANQIVENFALAHPEFRERLEKIKVQKEAMIEQIKELLEDSGSNHSANLIRELQKEWKKLGSIGIQDSELQKEWKNINDDFFTRRRDQLEIQEQARKNNLQKKILLCEEAERLIENLNDENREEAKNHVKHLRRLWKEIGAVPRRHSDKIWKRFNKACDTIFENHQSNATDMD